MTGSLLRGGLGFTAVSLGGFAPWALAGKWLTSQISIYGMYAVCCAVFLALPGIFLHRLVTGERSFLRFHFVFIPAFLAYAAVWCAAWFLIEHRERDWLGSAAGSVAFALVVVLMLGKLRSLAMTSVVLFVGHSAGYWGGEIAYGLFKGVTGMLAWGVCYGLGFGLGIGYTFYAAQADKLKASS